MKLFPPASHYDIDPSINQVKQKRSRSHLHLARKAIAVTIGTIGRFSHSHGSLREYGAGEKGRLEACTTMNTAKNHSDHP